MPSYDAGSAFVSVLPETRSFKQRLQRDMAAIKQDVTVPVNLDVRKDGLKSLETALRALPATVVVNGNTSPAQRQVAELRTRLESLSDKTVGVDISAERAKAEVASIKGELDRLGAKSVDIGVQVDSAAASAALSRFDQEVSGLDGRTARLRVDADTAGATGSLATVRAAAAEIDGRRLNMSVAADVGSAIAQLASLAVAANQFANRRYSFTVEADTAGAVASIAALIAKVGALGGLAGVVGGLGGALGGVGAAGAVAGAGLGAVVLSSLGVGKALSAMSAQQDSAASTARQSAQQQAQAAYQVESAQTRVSQASQKASQARSDAAKSVARAEADSAQQIAQAQRGVQTAVAAAQKARADAARQVESALQQQAMAEQRVQIASQALRIAQQDLTRAWEDGRRSLQDLQDQLDMSVIDQRQAALDLKDAEKRLAQARASGNADEIERAQIAYDRQVETIDQLGKRTQRLGVDNTAAQRAGVAGTDQYKSAMDRVTSAQQQQADAVRAAGQAAQAVNDARRNGSEQIAAADQRVADAQRALSEAEVKGAQRVADAREQGARQIQAADQSLMEAQRALQQALSQTGSAGEAAADKVAQAFANLSPAAAAFARYLFGLKPALDQLSATAATAFFPPLQAGIQSLVNQLPLINTVVGQLAGAMGTALGGVLTELANPFWMGFFQMLGNAAGTVIPGLFGAIMSVARAAAMLIQAFLPLAPAGFAVVEALSGLIGYLAPFLASAFGGMIPASQAFIGALYPLGPLLQALSPILNILGVAFSQVLGAVLQALTPVLIALTPLIQALATQIASGLVASIQAATPWLVGIATWMSENPGLVMGVAAAIGTLMGFMQPLTWLLGLLATMAVRAMLIGGLTSIFAALGLQGSVFARALLFILQPFSAIRAGMAALGAASSAAGGPLALLRQGVMLLGRALLTALGPIGWIGLAFGILYSSSAPFRDAINGVLQILMQLVGQIVSAVMPIFNALSSAFSLIAGVVGQLVAQLATALVPVINLISGVLSGLISAILPPLVSIINALVPIITMLAQVFAQVLGAVLGPVIGALSSLIAAILPPLIMILQTVVIPVIQMLANLFAGVLSFVITNVLIPALQFLMPIITWLANLLGQVLAWIITSVVVPALNMLPPIFNWVGGVAMWLWTNAIQPAFNAIGVFIGWVWNTLIKPYLEALVWFWQNVIAPTAMWLWTNIIQPTFNAIGAFIGWVWNTLIKPAFDALVWFITNVIVPTVTWLWINIVQPIFNALGAFIAFVWNYIIKPAFDALVWFITTIIVPTINWLWNNIVRPVFQALGDFIAFVWNNIIRPAFDAIKQGLQWVGEKFDQAVNWIRDIWERIRGILAKPINFLIDVVWNKGILQAWNAVAGLLGIPPIQPLGLIPEAASGGYLGGTQAAAGGGKLRGPGTPTSDSILGIDAAGMATAKVSRDEFVVNAAVTKRTLPFLTALNAGHGEALQAAGGLARVAPKKYSGRDHHGFDVNVPRRAGGGPIGLPHLAAGGGPFQQRIDQAKQWLSTTARGAPYVYGGGTNPRAGMDCSSMQSAVTHILSGRPPDSGRIGTTATMPWGGFAPGLNSQYSIGNKPSDHMAGTLAGQNVEQHGPNGTPFSFPSRWGADNGYFTQRWSLPIVGGQFTSGGEGGGWFNWILDKARSVFDEFTNPAIDAIRGFVGEPPPEWRRVPVSLATLIRDKARDFIFGKAEEQGGGDIDVSGISGPVVDQVRQVAARFGWDQGPEWDAIMKIVAKESTWNPNAANSGSSARGLFQKMTSLYGPVEPTPAGQAAWGLGYIRDRYGTPTRAWDFHQRNGSYAQGGQVKPFDAGGIARGKGIMFKDVIAPERTLDPQETQAYPTLTRLSQQLEAGRIRISTLSGADVDALPGRGAAAAGAAVQIGSVVVPPGASANDLAREVTWQVRSARRSGVYD